MLSVLNNKKLFYNKNMMDYCRNSTKESIQKFVEREKQKSNIDLKINSSQVLSNNNNNNGVAFFVILSVSSFIYYFFNARK
jgi:hypothetical protein